MKFIHVHLLYLIWIIPGLFFLYLTGMRKRRRILHGYAAKHARISILTGHNGSYRKLKAVLVIISVLFLVISLAGPQYGFKWQEIEQKGVDLIIAIDCSRSMLATDIKPTRLERAKREIRDLLNMIEGDRAGLVAFAGVSFLQCPLTLDYNAFNLFMNTLSPDFIPVGGTDLDHVIRTSIESFNQDDHTDKAIILITDGEITGKDPLKAAEDAREKGIKIFSIGVGSRDGVPVPSADGGFVKDKKGKIVLTQMDDTILKKIAALTGGTYVHSVAGDMDLEEIYLNRIRTDMQESTLASGKKKIWENRFQWFVLVSTLLILLDLYLPVLRTNNKKTILILAGLIFFGNADKTVHAFSFETQLNQAEKAYQEERFEDAVTHYIKAQLDDPEDNEIYYNLGNSYFRSGDYESAISNFKKASETETKTLKEKSFFNIGNSYYRQGNLEESIKQYEKVLELNPDDKKTKENIEFVKRRLQEEKQKQEQQESQDNKENQDKQENNQETDNNNNTGQNDEQENDQKSENQNQNADENKQGNQEQQEKETPDEVKPDSDQATNQDQDSAGQNRKSGDAEKQESNEADQEKQEQQEGESEQESEKNVQNRAVLNRLQDSPGRALIPHINPGTVEKDW